MPRILTQFFSKLNNDVNFWDSDGEEDDDESDNADENDDNDDDNENEDDKKMTLN